MGELPRQVKSVNKSVVINNQFRISKRKQGDFILADVRNDKKTNVVFYPTIAIYSNEIKLIADIINLSVKRAVFLKTITSINDMMRESHLIAELCRGAFNQLNKNEGASNA